MLQSNQVTNHFMLVLVLACAGIFLGSAGADEEVSMTLDEVVDMIQPFGEGCDPVPEKESIMEMVQNKEDAKRETKCFRHCMLQQFELMPEGQLQFNEDKTAEMMNMMFPDNEDDSRRIIKACNDRMKAEQDKCEAAHGISMCMLKEMRASGYKIPEIKE